MSIENQDVNVVKNKKTAEITQPQHALPQYNSGELFQGKNELTIAHAQEVYRLRITRHGKLILTK